MPTSTKLYGTRLTALGITTAIVLTAAFTLAAFYAPIEADQGFSQKIFYLHVPLAIVTLGGFVFGGICAIQYLRSGDPRHDLRSYTAIHQSLIFCIGALLTGSIWAKAAWGHWWIWERRLTMSLLLELTLVGYVLVRRFAGSSGDRLASAMAIFAMISIPFIYIMVGADDSHPQAGPDGNIANLDPRMRPTLYLGMLTFLFWFMALVALRIRSVRMEREVRELRERGLDAGVLA